TQLRAGTVEVLGGIDLGIILGQQGVLGLGVGLEFLVAFLRHRIALVEEVVLRPLEGGPQLVIDLAWCTACGLPLLHQVTEGTGGVSPVCGLLQGLGAFEAGLLELAGGGPATVQVGEVGTTPAVEGVTGAGVTLPQLIIGFAFTAVDGLPLIQDGADAVAGDLPVGGVLRDVLGLGGQGLLAGDGLLAALRLLLPGALVGLLGGFN